MWRHTNIMILLWNYAIITSAENTAYLAWSQLVEFFLANQPALAVHLSADFRTITQGDLWVPEYRCRLNVDESVPDRTMTLQMRGLSCHF